MAPKCSPEVISSVPKVKNAVMCLLEKLDVLDKLHSSMSYTAVAHEFCRGRRNSPLYLSQVLMAGLITDMRPD